MLHRKITAFCCEIQTEHTNAICGQNSEFPKVKPGDTRK